MKTIWMVKVTTHLGESWFYAGVQNQALAFLMAARNGFDSDQVEAKEIPNKFGIQPGEWTSAI